MSLFATLFECASGPVVVEEADPRESSFDEREFFPEERALIERAAASRRTDFLAGRVLARRAFARLGVPPQPLLAGPDRAPVWPEGLVGSISHTAGWVAVAVATTSSGVRSLGLDVEQASPLKEGLFRMVCRPEEREFLAALAPEERGLTAKTIFSAKECVYKAQYPLSRTFLGFQAVSISLAPGDDRFEATFHVDIPGLGPPGTRMGGRVATANGLIATVARV